MVFTPIAEKLGVRTECEVMRRGYYPKGNGEVYLKIHPVKELNPINIVDFGDLKRINGRAFVAGHLPIEIAKRMANTVIKELKNVYKNIPVEIEIVKEPDHTYIGTGTGLIVVAETTTGCILAGSALGKKGVTAEAVGLEAAQQLIEDLGHEACVDQFMQDQLIIFMGLANGISRIKTGPLTLHTKTAIHYTQLITGAKFEVKTVNSGNIIECTGIGYKNKFFH
jgi:RNA 3'-terminal phosphate cyclase (ATP)